MTPVVLGWSLLEARRHRAGKRGREAAVPVLLESMAASLRAGDSVAGGLAAAAAAGGPLGPDLRSALARCEAGVPLRRALLELRRGHPGGSLELAVTGLVVGLDAGGAQAGTLDALAATVRGRLVASEEIRALSAQVRVSAWVVGAAPVVGLALLGAIDAGVLVAAVTTPAGALGAMAGCGLEGVGVWWMRRLVAASELRAGVGDEDLPDVVDLVALAVRAGMTVPDALAVVAPLASGRSGRVLRSTLARTEARWPLSGEIATWPARYGESFRPFSTALVGAVDDGAPIGPTLERVAGDVRARRRARAEEAARRLPVLLLFPLVACILPAFVLLTVVPLVVHAAGSLHLGS